MTKDEIKAQLDELGVEYDASSKKEDLEELLSATKPKETLPETTQETAPKDGSREERWKQFLANYQAQNPAKYEIKKKRGEFDSIPDSFK